MSSLINDVIFEKLVYDNAMFFPDYFVSGSMKKHGWSMYVHYDTKTSNRQPIKYLWCEKKSDIIW